MSTKIQRLPRKKLPFGKYRYQIVCMDNNDKRKLRRDNDAYWNRFFDIMNDSSKIKQYFKAHGEGKCRLEDSPSPCAMYFENWNDVLKLKMCWPHFPRKIYCVELFD